MDSGSRTGQRSVGYRFFIATLIALGLTAGASTPATAQSGYTPVTVQFSASNYTVSESGGMATITVTLSQASTSDVQVNYATSDGTAVAYTDYRPASGTLDFPPGTTSQTFTVNVFDNNVSGPSKTVNLTLSNPVNASLGMPWQATLTILDDDPPQVTVQFSAATYTASESSPSATITVTLSQATTVPVTVEYVSSDGTALSGTDYTAVSGLLTFNPGDTQQTFQVPIIDDGMIDPDETVNLTLQYPTFASLGSPSTAVLTIMDDHPAVSVSFSPSPVLVQPSGTASLTATVTPPDQSASVTFTSSDSTIATVTGSAPNLTVTGVATGTAQINAMVGPNVVGSVTVYVVTVTFSPNPALVPVGQTTSVTAEVLPSDATQYLTFSIANTTIASMTGTAPNFTVTGVAAGSTSITATNGGVTFGTGTINVVNTNVTVTFSPSPVWVAAGQSVTVTATVTPTSEISNVTYAITDSSVATLSGVTQTSTGATMTVTGVKEGSETTLTASDNGTAVRDVPVKVPGVVFDTDPVVVGVNFTANLKATVTPADAAVTFDTANGMIATVAAAAGKPVPLTVTGKAVGTTNLQANFGGKVIKTATINVAQVTFNPNPVWVAQDMTVQVSVTVTPAGITPITYDTADGTIANVTAGANGPIVTVKGLKAGSVTQLRAKYKNSDKNLLGTVNVNVFNATGIQATLTATANPTGAAVPADASPIGKTQYRTTATATDFNPASLMVVVKDAGAVTVTLQGSANLPAAITAGAVKTKVDRNPADKVAAGLVTFGGAGPNYTLTPDNPGNFRVIFYYDQNANGQYDAGEELRVLANAIVRVTLKTGSTLTYSTPNLLTFEDGGKDPVWELPIHNMGTKKVSMYMQATILFEGGGADGKIGVSQVVAGNIGNLTADNQTCSYPKTPGGAGNLGKDGTGAEDPDFNQNPAAGFASPMVDTGGVAKGKQPTGGSSCFRGSNSSGADVNAASGIGVERTITSGDSPGFGNPPNDYKKKHPTTTNIWNTTDGGYNFTEYIAAYSNSFTRNYYVLGKANWAVVWKGKRGGGDAWTDTGSSSTGDPTLTVVQTDGTSAKIQVLGFSYARELGYIYTP